MASSYTGLGTELMTTGENAGSWGTTTNTNLQIIEQISGGYTEQSIAGGVQTTTLSVSDGSTGAVLSHRVIKFTGTITGNQTVTIPLDVQQMYVLVNGTSGAYTVNFKYASGSGSSVTFAATDKGTKLVYATADHATNPNIVDSGIASTGDHDLDGNELILDADADTSITADTDDQIDIKVGGTDRVRITTGAIAPSSADGVALGTSALEFSDLFLADSSVIKFGADQDTTLTHTDGTGLTLNSTNKLCFYDTALYIHSSTDGQLDLVADTEIQIAATTIDINGAVAMDGAITGATNITLSGELDAATLDISGNADIDGTMEADAYTIGGASFIKVEGTNFTDSLLVGHTTTGTLDAAQDNTGVGIDALDALTSGDNNTAVGSSAGSATTTGSKGTFIGCQAGMLSDANSNTAVGYAAFDAANNASTHNNVAIGIDSLGAAGSGVAATYNTAVGKSSGVAVTSGDYNLLLGADAGDNLTTGSGNIIIGTGDAAAADSARTFKVISYDGSSTTNHIISDSSGNMTLAADLTIGDDLNLDSDSAALTFGDDQEITLTHVHNAGLLLNSSYYLTFRDSALAISSSTDGQLDIDADTEVEIATTTLDLNGALDVSGASQFSGAVTVGVDDTGLDVKFFGASAGAYMEWDESADQLRIMGASADATTSTGKLLLATSLTNINANDVIGKIEFQAPHEAGGTDAITVAASIQALAQDTFSASVNATDLIFYTGHSEANTEKFRFTSQGELGVGGANYGTDGQVLTSTGAGTAPAWETVAGGLTGKVEGTNFTDSLLVGHSTTGTLDAAIRNTGVGIDTLDALTTGDDNVALGYNTASRITTGTKNTIIGVSAGDAAETKTENTCLGYTAGILLQGNYTTLIGSKAGDSMTSGNFNVCLGRESGENLTTADGCLILGSVDSDDATTALQLKIGNTDGAGNSATWLKGDSAGKLVATGGDVVVGKIEGTNFTDSLLVGHSTTGTLDAAQDNTGVGIDSMDAITSGDRNTVVGSSAGSAITSGARNTYIGTEAGLTSTTVSNNTGIGDKALKVATGANNTALGQQSGVAVAAGAYNVTVGYTAGKNITSGDGNIVIGNVDAASATDDVTLKITGYDGTTTANWIAGDSSGNLTFPADVTLGDDLLLDSDAAVLKFGDDGEITLTHDADVGLKLKHTATADDKPIVLTLQTGETDMAANDVMGAIRFQAPDEGTGTDAILVAAAIQAVAEGDFSSSNNATTLEFHTGASEAASSKMTLSSAGLLTVTDDLIVKSGGTIGGAGDTDLLTLGSAILTVAGEVQMTTLDIGGTNVSATAAEINYSDLATLGTSAASKVLSADSNNLTKITGGVYLEEDTLSFDATQDWDVRASPVAQVTLTANVTFDAPSNPTTGQYISVLCIQDGTGSRTIAWNAVFEFTGGTAPTATTTAGKGDLFTFRYHNSHWIEVGRNLNLTRA